ncbi:unnamed protein product [Prorocentrum cordatum]|uniref:RRM domain-containing protein n=1 Tax=Prorocentrum cordatum TaxID=2364126 RepID=A0ABN9UYX1_9DINO|nr:unnamed protein product [Polarella glacialis]
MAKGGKKGWGGAYDPYGMWGAKGGCKGAYDPYGMWGSKGAKTGCKGGGKGGGGKGPGKAELLGYPADKKVWVGDLPAGCTADDLMAHFGLAGSVQHVALMRTGTAGVVFSDAAEAEAAVVHLNGTEINDQAVKVEAWQQAA